MTPPKQIKPSTAFANARIWNPKRHADPDGAQQSRLFSYYAGYSVSFASTLLSALDLRKNASIMDPWNGSGITTHTARRFGYKSIGQDLNPVMVLVAKAELLAPNEVGRLFQSQARSSLPLRTCDDTRWMKIRWRSGYTRILRRTYALWSAPYALRSRHDHRPICDEAEFDDMSSLAAFFYVVLFSVAKKLLGRFKASNPT